MSLVMLALRIFGYGGGICRVVGSTIKLGFDIELTRPVCIVTVEAEGELVGGEGVGAFRTAEILGTQLIVCVGGTVYVVAVLAIARSVALAGQDRRSGRVHASCVSGRVPGRVVNGHAWPSAIAREPARVTRRVDRERAGGGCVACGTHGVVIACERREVYLRAPARGHCADSE